MDINSLPTGTACLIDANIFIYYLTGASQDCKYLLQRIATGDIDAHVNTIIIAEVLHRRMVGEAIARGLVSRSKALQKLKASPSLVKELTHHIEEVDRLLRLPIRILEVAPSDIHIGNALRRTHGLLVNDSINLACAQRHQIVDVVSNDRDFGSVPAIALWEPGDA